jgi:exo-beta-1,3-glucanase (GH17 family)
LAVLVIGLVGARTPLAASSGAAEPALHCIAFSAYVGAFSPNTGPHPPPSVIDALLDDLVTHTDFRCVMTYGVLNGQDYVFEAARRRGLTVIAIVWLDGDRAVNQQSVSTGIEAANRYRDTIVRVGCGSEVRTRRGAVVAETVVGECVSRMRASGVTQPIGTNTLWFDACNETWPCKPWRFLDRLDFIGVNAYAWWDNKYSGLFPCTTTGAAADFHVARLRDVRSIYPSKEVILTEFGWPAGPDGYSEVNRFTRQRCGIASVSNQRLVVEATIAQLRRLNLPHTVFAAYREPWKNGAEGPVGSWWGLLAAPAEVR